MVDPVTARVAIHWRVVLTYGIYLEPIRIASLKGLFRVLNDQ